MDTERDNYDDATSTALPVDGCTFSRQELEYRIDNGLDAQDAQEYLARVRLEASRIPSVVQVDQEKLKAIQQMVAAEDEHVQYNLPEDIVKPLPGTEPSQEWRQAVIQDFITCRQLLASAELNDQDIQIPKKNDRNAWERLFTTKSPSTQLLLRVEQKIASKVIKDMIYENDNYVFTSDRCVWMYALLARIEKPLSLGMEANFRKLLRLLSKDRDTRYVLDRPSIDTIICLLQDYFAA
mmetsp:Transcript_23808/g.37907  ORF Transcript_23808/g.37907 Transcript_23808/m.37907 type:complete len:238 (-) Transcript_23808:812-1525(-)